jgi:hypothetical protein
LGKKGLVVSVIGEIKRLTNIVIPGIKDIFNYFINSDRITYQSSKWIEKLSWDNITNLPI